MSVTELERVRSQDPLDDRLAALGQSLQHAFPMSECRSFGGLMNALDPDREAPEIERGAFSWRAG